MRASLLSVFVLLATVGIASAYPQTVTNPVPSRGPCPDGKPRIEWHYPPDGGIPSNGTAVACDADGGCMAFPIDACLELVDVTKKPPKPDIPPMNSPPPKPPASVPDPPLVPPSPSSVRPNVPTDGTPSPMVPDRACRTGRRRPYRARLRDIRRRSAA